MTDTPTKPYTAVESDWIKEEIKQRNFDDPEDREYINTLVYFEHRILNPPQQWAAGYQWGHARNQHPEIYDRLQKELKPDAYRKRKERERQEEQKQEQRRQERQRLHERRQRQAREQWKQIRADGGDE